MCISLVIVMSCCVLHVWKTNSGQCPGPDSSDADIKFCVQAEVKPPAVNRKQRHIDLFSCVPEPWPSWKMNSAGLQSWRQAYRNPVTRAQVNLLNVKPNLSGRKWVYLPQQVFTSNLYLPATYFLNLIHCWACMVNQTEHKSALHIHGHVCS